MVLVAAIWLQGRQTSIVTVAFSGALGTAPSAHPKPDFAGRRDSQPEAASPLSTRRNLTVDHNPPRCVVAA
jgi:hypothetical protein